MLLISNSKGFAMDFSPVACISIFEKSFDYLLNEYNNAMKSPFSYLPMCPYFYDDIWSWRIFSVCQSVIEKQLTYARTVLKLIQSYTSLFIFFFRSIGLSMISIWHRLKILKAIRNDIWRKIVAILTQT